MFSIEAFVRRVDGSHHFVTVPTQAYTAEAQLTKCRNSLKKGETLIAAALADDSLVICDFRTRQKFFQHFSDRLQFPGSDDVDVDEIRENPIVEVHALLGRHCLHCGYSQQAPSYPLPSVKHRCITSIRSVWVIWPQAGA